MVDQCIGLTPAKLNVALQLLHSDTQLYIDILTTLQLNQIENLPWKEVVGKIKTLVMAKKPFAWPGVDQFLQSLHWAPQPSYHTATATTGSSAAEENDDDDILQMVEGVDYYADEDALPEGEEYDQHYAAFLKNVQDTKAAHNFTADFGKMAVTDNRHVVETC